MVCDRVTLIDRGKVIATESPRTLGQVLERLVGAGVTSVRTSLPSLEVPLSYYPEPVEILSRLLPLTNGLLAIRGVFGGAPASEIVENTALEAAVGLAWMVAALLTFNRLASRGRRDGSLDYGA